MLAWFLLLSAPGRLDTCGTAVQFCLLSWRLLSQQAAPEGRYCNGPAKERPGTVLGGHREARVWATQEPAEEGLSRVVSCSGGCPRAGQWEGHEGKCEEHG